MIGTHQPVVARLEDADYDGHSLAMLKRIAGALNKRLQVRFVDSASFHAGGSFELANVSQQWPFAQDSWTPTIKHPDTLPFVSQRRADAS